MGALLSDLRYGLRILAANPGFAVVAILSLAIGIGANTAMFSLADAILWRPLPVPNASGMVRVSSTSQAEPLGRISYPDFKDFRDQTKSFAGLVASRTVPIGLSPNPGAPTQLMLGLVVTPNYFDALGIKPALGRSFRADEDREAVAMISDSTWEAQFGRDPSVIGRTVKLSKIDFTIIGVVPKSFPGLDRYVHEALYVPLGMMLRLDPDDKNPLGHRERTNVTVYGRLAPGRSATQAQAELKTIAGNLERAYPDTNRGRSVLAMPELQYRESVDPGDAAQMVILLAIAGLVLLIACANVASLLLSRARARAREIAIRLAIGAGRGRLLRQLLTESLLLSLAGGAAGLGLAMLGIRFLGSIRLPLSLPLWLVEQLDVRVLLFCAASALLSGVVFGIAPALHTLRTDLGATLKAGDAALSGKRQRFQVRNVLVTGQVAISMILLLAAGLLVKDFARVNPAQAGFRTDHLLLLPLDPSLLGYNEQQGRAFYRQLVQGVGSLPGVRSVSLGQHIPLGVTSSSKEVVVEGYEMPRGQQSISLLSDTVDDHYFSLMHIPVLSGRNFASSDTAGAPPVAIVNEAMAQAYWPKRSPIGGRIHIGKQTLEVVGVAKTIKYRDLSETPQPFLYLPFSQRYDSYMTVHVETAVDPATLAAPVLAEIRRLDPGTPVQDVQTMQHFFTEGALFWNRLLAQVVTTIGLFGLVLAVTGLYGVVAYSVSRRTREIGIRMAIGADAGDVARLVLRQGMWLTVIGAAIGLALALLASRLLGSLLVGVSARDPGVYIAVPLLLAAVSLLACYVPARRAARIDPLLALRQD